MARFILFLLLLIPLSAAGMWLMDNPGFITIEWFGYEIRLAMAAALITLTLALFVVIWLALLFWQLLNWPERRGLRKKLHHTEKGLQMLTRSVTALALHDSVAAEKSLHQAVRLLPQSALPRLLAAQLAQSQGNSEKSAEHLRFLLADKDTSIFATRRLIDQRMQQKNYEEALILALQAHQDQPRDHWTTLVLVDLYFRCSRLDDVIALCTGVKLHSALSREERHRFAAIAYYQRAIKELEPLAKIRALKHATNYAPEFLPAVILFAQHYSEHNQPRDALKILRRAWAHAPQPSLMAMLMALLAPMNPRQQRRMAATLAAKAKGTAEAALLEAHIAKDQERYDDAATILQAAIAQHDRKPLYALMAEVAPKIEGKQSDATTWMKRAMDAPNEPRWHCASCGAMQSQWELHCSSCGALDSSVWGQPEMTKAEVQLQQK
jgi:HemY protein